PVARDQPDAGLGERQRGGAPALGDAGPDRGDGAEGGVGGVEELLAGGQRRRLGVEGGGGAGALLGRERLLRAGPAEADAAGGHGGAEPHGGRAGALGPR